MRSKLIALLLALAMCLSLAACTQTAPAAEETAAPIEATPDVIGEGTQALVTTAVAARGTAWVDSELVGTVSADSDIRAQDDFAAHVNRDWIASAAIPDGRSSVSAFSELGDELDAEMKSLLTDTTLTSHEAQLVQSLYSVVTDWDTRNALGVEPIAPQMSAIEHITSLDQMTEFLTGYAMDLGLALFSVSPSADLDVPTEYTVLIDSTALCLNDADEYNSGMTDLGQLYYTLYHDTSVYLLQRLGYTEDEALDVMEGCLAFEALCAEHELPLSAMYEADFYGRINNTYDRAGLEELAGSFPLLPILDAYGYGASAKYLLAEPEWLGAMGDIYTEENLEDIKDYLKVRLAVGTCAALDREAYDKAVEISNAVNGITGTEDDGTAAYNVVAALLAGPMNNLYIEKFCSEKTREDITEIINEIIDHYRVMLSEEDWLSDEMRAGSVEKLDSMTVRAAYPDKLDDYSALEIAGAADGGTYLDAILAINRFSRTDSLRYVNAKVDPEEWGMPVNQVNAAYNPQDNSINILNGILGGVFYNENASREENLGGIGVVIGHEISHAFDTSGSQFDKDGVLKNWWTDADRAAFNDRAAKLIAYYDGIVPYEGADNYNGTQVQTEAIADMGGLKCMLAIAADDPDFDYDLFFRSFAAIWREQCTAENELQLAQLDTHPLAFLRVNVTVQQFDEFYETYDIQPGDGMYLAPEERIAVW